MSVSTRSLRVPLRGLARSPRLAFAALLCIAIGAAAVGAMATLVRATLLRPLPFPDADRLVRLWLEDPQEPRLSLSYPLVERIRAEAESLDALEVTARARILVFGGEAGRRVEGEAVSPGYFELLAIEPVIGRLFAPEEYRPGHEGIVVIGHALWRDRFGLAPDVVGQFLRTEIGPLEIVGVLPPGFTGTVEEDAGEIELWLPVDHYLDAEDRGSWGRAGIWVIGRLRPGVDGAAAGEELAAIAGRLAADQPRLMAERNLTAEPLGENWRAGLRRGSWLLVGAAVGLLLVAASNVSALLLARSLERRREWALQRALGAPARAIVATLAGEALLIAGVGGLLGAWAGAAALPWLLAQADVVLPDYVRPTIDPATALVVAAVLAAAGLLATLAPALVSLRADPAGALREGGRGGTDGRGAERLWSGLVVAEVALAMVLAFGAVSLVRSWQTLLGEDLGFRTSDVLRLALFPGPEQTADPAARRPFLEAARDRLAAEPGVSAVGLVWPTIPIWGAVQEAVRWPEMPESERERGHRVALFLADEHLLQTLEVPRLAGRGFRADDGAGVAIVSRSLAERLGGVREALGRELALADGPVRIVGVVEDVAFGGARGRDAERETLLLPLASTPVPYATLMVRTQGDPEPLVAPLAKTLGTIAPASALDWTGTLDFWLGERYKDARFAPVLLGLFAASAALITGVGVFALMSAGVARRRTEIGIRKALGASPRASASLVIGRGVRLVALGAVVGGAASWLLARTLDSLLYGVGPREPLSFALACFGLVAIAALAAAIPARRAAAVEPMAALRPE